MSTTPQVVMKCAVCGTRSEHPSVNSSSCTYGPRDLDTRPPLPLRAALPALVMSCPSCGYCSRFLMEAGEAVRPILETPEYRAQSADESYPPLANRFLCAALIADARDQLVNAAWNRVHAAWACDDQDATDAARRCREQAIETFRRARAQGIAVIEGGQGDALLLADLLRRAGRFEEAAEELATGLAAEPPEILANLFRLEAKLVEAGDADCHTVPAIDPLAG